jgi:hypothetical protein
VGLVVFVFELAEQFVERVDKNDIDAVELATFEQFGAQSVSTERETAQVPDKEGILLDRESAG